jgi:hypothetical protein
VKHTLIIIETNEAGRIEEALRAALGLTLRGAQVEVWIEDALPLTATASRALAVLQSFGHRVGHGGDFETLLASDAVEVWT